MRITLLAFAGAISLLGGSLQLSAASPPDAAKDLTVLATIGKQRVTQAEVLAQDAAAFERQTSGYQRQLRLLEENYAQARHELLQQQLDKLLDQAALQREAAKRGVSADTVLAEIKVSAVSDEEVRAYYEANKDRTNQTFEQLATQIKQHLALQHNEQAARAFYDSLRAKFQIVSLLEPYRVSVVASGPVRGPRNAPVTVVEFGDFECPYCRLEEPVLRALLAKYPTQVRLVFRNLPLTQLHPNAMAAAQAAVCADRQGKYWEMHDALYANPSSLEPGSLKDMAQRVGLERDLFTKCLSDPSMMKTIETDVQEADRLGVAATPHFFINGRPISGGVPLDKLDALVTQELHRASLASR